MHTESEFRVFYVAYFREAAYVLHCFVKKRKKRGRPRSPWGGNVIMRCWKGGEMKVIQGSGNVFLDIGFSPAEARNLRMRSQMMIALRKFIQKEGLTQAEAAKRLKVTQPRISELVRGKIGRFSLDSLVNMLGDAGLDVDLRIKAKPARRVA